MPILAWVWKTQEGRKCYWGTTMHGEDTSSITPKGSLFTSDPTLFDDPLTTANRLLISAYGNTTHDYNWLHMSDGIVDGKLWQKFWTNLTALPIQHYDVPS
eukprot:5372861-Ditylum_brightwellii.AAC.1